MALYKCKCGDTADSKCAASRTIFPSNQLAAALTWSLKEEFKEITNRSDGVRLIEVHLIRIAENKGELTNERKEELMWEFIKAIRSFPEDALKSWNCHHEWVLQSDECELGCCKKEAT